MIQDIKPRRLINHYDPEKKPSPSSPVLLFDGRSVLLKDRAEGAGLLRYSDFMDQVSAQDLTYLFSIDEEDYFLLPDSCQTPASGCSFYKVRDIRSKHLLEKPEAFAVNTGRQLAAWYRDNRFCGTCGSETVHSRTERALVCPSCGRTIYPRIQPAVIVGVTHGDQILITRYSDRPLAYDSLVAGFTEIGETFEQTVEREVMEETGLKVKNIRYYKSQPWAISDDILAGYYCDVDGDPTVHIDESELKRALWTRREDITGQPDDYSLTNEMMMVFKAGKEPR